MRTLKLLALSAMVFVSGCAGSAGGPARERALLPVLRSEWPIVEANVERGIADGVQDGDVTEAAADDLLDSADRLEHSLQSLTEARAVAWVEWPTLHHYALRGILDRVDDGEIVPGAGESLEEHVIQFDEAIQKLQETR